MALCRSDNSHFCRFLITDVTQCCLLKQQLILSRVFARQRYTHGLTARPSFTDTYKHTHTPVFDQSVTHVMSHTAHGRIYLDQTHSRIATTCFFFYLSTTGSCLTWVCLSFAIAHECAHGKSTPHTMDLFVSFACAAASTQKIKLTETVINATRLDGHVFVHKYCSLELSGC